jgi:MYXO-CTERM domain-containing protein
MPVWLFLHTEYAMTFLWNVVRSGAPAAALAAMALVQPRNAEACGGCFHPENDVGGSVVTDHRMVFEITSKETILWDQVRYAGDPSEFAWVLPVRAGARIELSRGEWIAALDAATRTTVDGPRPVCPPTTTTSSGRSSSSSSSSSSSGSSSSGGGCGGGYTPTSETAAGVGNGGTTSDDSSSSTNPTFTGDDNVDVVAQSSIGPYQAVTIRASGSTGITQWLKSNGFAVPASMMPVIDGYIAQKLDFIALRLAPNQGVQAMRPIRVVTPGADTTLPLRMVAAGVGATVGLTLWVIGEGRYETQNFPNAPVDWRSLAWDVTQRRSNRTILEAAALASNGGRSWITEAAIRTSLTDVGAGIPGSGMILPNVHDAYLSQCQYRPARKVPCDETALPPPDGKPGDVVATTDPDAGTDGGAPDAATADADTDAGDAADASGADASSADGGNGDGGVACTKMVSGCDGFDDLDVGAAGLHAGDVWVTRLRADLPVSALATDLELAASAQQIELSPAHKTSKFTDPLFDPCTGTRSRATSSSGSSGAGLGNGGADGCSCRTAPVKEGLGTWLLIGVTMVALPLLTRRRRRK